MQRLISLIVTAIAVIAGYKETIAELKAEIQRLRDDNARLAGDDQADKDAIKAAQDRNAEMEAHIKEAESKADELARAINAEPMTPNVDPEFAVTGNQGVIGLSDAELEMRARDAEGRGQVPPRIDPNLPPRTREAMARAVTGEEAGAGAPAPASAESLQRAAIQAEEERLGRTLNDDERRAVEERVRRENTR